MSNQYRYKHITRDGWGGGDLQKKNLGTGLAPVDLVIFWGFSLVNSALSNYPLSSHEDMASEISQFVQFSMFIILPVFSSYKTNPHLAVHQPYHAFRGNSAV